MYAARDGHEEIVKLLLAAKADTKVKSKSGEMALMLAYENGHKNIAKLLLEAE